VTGAKTERVAVIILAAGKSTRMGSDLPKVLHEVCGRPMLAHVIGEARSVATERLLVVVGHGKQAVIDRFAGERDLEWVRQPQQLGTGHAVLCCKEALGEFRGTVLVIAGDMPLVRRSTLESLVRERVTRGDAATIATTVLGDATGYGRIVRDERGHLVAIVEHRDCTPQQLEIREVNPSYYCFDAREMNGALDRVRPSAKGELYLTDAIAVLRSGGKRVSAVVQAPAEDAMGVNSRRDLAAVNQVMQKRIQTSHMESGVTVVSPENTWIEADVRIGRDTTIHPFSYIAAGATIGEGCSIGPFAHVGRGQNIQSGAAMRANGMEARS
jgi:bifunctional UDP-N-acetylglucosamine pyrophosphorylase/glucosamine-1-phosphate N-acetyltransferase